MLSPAWCVLAKYKTLLRKMALDGLTNDKAKANFELLFYVQLLLGLATILTML
jgi:hypothetical protein